MLVHRFAFVGIASVVLGLSALAGFARAEDSLWQTDFEAAKAKAKAEKKLLLVDFTGSDWCGWCKKLVAEVFGKEEFKKEAPKKFVLVELDYPTPAKKQSDELKKQNKELLKRYKVQGYPTILVMDAEGNVIAKTGYQPDGPEKYVKHLKAFVEAYGDIVKMKQEAEKAQGLDRVKAYDKVVEAYTAKLNNPDGDAVVALSKQIVALDPDNKSGLKSKHEFVLLMAEFNELKDQRKLVEAKAVADKLLALPGVASEQRQSACMPLCEFFFGQGDFVTLVACLKKGIEAGPDSPQANQFKTILKQFQPMADAQQAVVKLKVELDTVKGLDRAKVLDKLVEAQSKLASVSRGGGAGQDIEKWSREIVTLDADNKAGLKTKYECRLMVGDAGKLFQQPGKQDEGHALIAKALALPGVTGELKQQAYFVDAMSYVKEKEFEKGIEGLKKALDAAPESRQAAFIKQLIERVETQVKAQKGDKKAEEK
jgi:thioredoxin-related protein